MAPPAGMTGEAPRRVAIACQGGGSHTAFTAGVLSRLFDAPELDPQLGGYRVVGLSGTSGGAVCALLAWSALCKDDPHAARTLLEGFWADNAASTPADAAVNAWLLWASTLQGSGLLPVVSPYDLPSTGADRFRELLGRQVDLDGVDVDALGAFPLLLVGAVDVLSGRFRAFHSRRDRITADVVLASAAIPTVFPAVHTHGGTFWDGLFSQNPPVRELLETKPDELWVIQINPTARADEPRTVLDIADRRNELAGNLSLFQELHVIEKVDQLLAEGLLVGDRYKQVTVRVLELARPRLSRLLGPASKLNRDPGFLRELMDQGERQAEEFLAVLAFERAWRARDLDAILPLLAHDAELTSVAPFQVREPVRGEQVHGAVADLSRDVRMDLTRKQLTRDRAAWTVRLDGGVRGRVEAEFDGRRLVRLRFGPEPT
jgi:NTE family protein